MSQCEQSSGSERCQEQRDPEEDKDLFTSAEKRGHGQECSSVSFTAESVDKKDLQPWQKQGLPWREAEEGQLWLRGRRGREVYLPKK